MHRLVSTSLLLSAIAVASLATATEIPTPITSSEYEAAASGEVLVQAERGEINRGQVIGFVDRPVESVAEIVIAVGDHDHWFPDTREADVLEQTETTNLVRGTTHIPVFRDRRWTLTGDYTQPTYNGVSCHLMEYDYVDDDYGNMDACFGYWLVCPHEEGSVVKYVINADLGMWLPQAIVNWAQRRMLPGIITGLAERYDELH